MFLDVKRALETISISKLIDKMYNKTKVLFNYRYQKFKATQSNMGYLQGIVLDTLLFIIHTNSKCC